MWEGLTEDYDLCPRCGPVLVTTDGAGRTIALAGDNSICSCDFVTREAHRVKRGLAVLPAAAPTESGTVQRTAASGGGRLVVRRGPRHILSVPKLPRNELLKRAGAPQRQAS